MRPDAAAETDSVANRVALHWAARNNTWEGAEVVAALLAAAPDTAFALDSSANTPLHIAGKGGCCAEVFQFLLDAHPAAAAAASNDAATPLHLAARYRAPADSVALLLAAAPACAAAKDASQKLPLQLACSSAQPDEGAIRAILAAHPAAATAEGPRDAHPVWPAVRSGTAGTVRCLLEANPAAAVNAVKMASTALHSVNLLAYAASETAHPAVLEAILDVCPEVLGAAAPESGGGGRGGDAPPAAAAGEAAAVPAAAAAKKGEPSVLSSVARWVGRAAANCRILAGERCGAALASSSPASAAPPTSLPPPVVVFRPSLLPTYGGRASLTACPLL